MADVWVLQNSDKSVAGVFGTKGAANRGGGDENARALPFDIVEPKAVAPVAVSPSEPIQILVPSDNADGAPLLDALNEIVRVLTNAKAPAPILDAVSKISAPAIEHYNRSASVEQPVAEPEVNPDEALGFLLGGEPEEEYSEPEDVVFAPVPQVNSLPQERDAGELDESDIAADPVSAFANPSATGMGDIVEPAREATNAALTDSVIGLSSWMLAADAPASRQQPVAQSRRERREQEAIAAGDSSASVVV